jgi:putative MATE family efflux protein
MHFSRTSAGDVLRLALPAVFEQVLVMLVFTLDTVMVGRYGGSQALAAIGVSAEMVATVSNIFVGMGISIATTSLVARAFGAGRLKRAEEYATLGILAAAASAFIIAVLVFLFAGSAVRAAGAEASVSLIASGYLRIVAVAIFFSMVLSSVNAVLRGYGNTKVPFVASAITTVTNLILDYGLIFGYLGMPELGVQGAAIATVIAQALGLTFSTAYMLKRSKVKPGLSHIQTLDIQRLKSFFRLSVPASMQEGSISLVRLIGQFMIIGLGTKALAANTMATMIESISFMPGWGFALAASALVGLKVGEGDHEGARAYAYTSVIMGSAVMGVISLLFLVFPQQLISMFVTGGEEEVVRLGALCLSIGAFEQPTMGASMISAGVLRGMGDTKTPFKVSFLTSWFIRMPLTIILIFFLKTPVWMVWVITAIYWLADSILLLKSMDSKLKSLGQI